MNPAADPVPLPDAPDDPAEARWPPEQFYWAVLHPQWPPAAVRRLRRGVTPQLRALLDGMLAPHLPIEMSEVAAAYTLLERGSVLACAVPAASLAECPGSLTLTPSATPPWLSAPGEPEKLNVLVDAYEPAAVASARRRRGTLTAVCIALTAILVAVGFERRAHMAISAGNAASLLADRILAAASSPGAVADEASLDRELSRLRATRNQDAKVGLADCAGPLAVLLRHWPADTPAQLRTLSADRRQITLTGLLPTHADVEALAAALSNAPGWAVGQPQASSGSKGVQLQLVLTASHPNGGGP